MSTDLIRRCDACRREIGPSGNVVVIEAAVTPVGRPPVTIPAPGLDACSEPCVIALVRGLFDQAMRSAFGVAGDDSRVPPGRPEPTSPARRAT